MKIQSLGKFGDYNTTLLSIFTILCRTYLLPVASVYTYTIFVLALPLPHFLVTTILLSILRCLYTHTHTYERCLLYALIL